MNAGVLFNLWSECESLAIQANVLLIQGYHRVDPEMAAFIGSYLVALQHGFYDALRVKSCEREALLRLIIGEMHDLVCDIQCRIAQAEVVEVLVETVRPPLATITPGKIRAL